MYVREEVFCNKHITIIEIDKRYKLLSKRRKKKFLNIVNSYVKGKIGKSSFNFDDYECITQNDRESYSLNAVTEAILYIKPDSITFYDRECKFENIVYALAKAGIRVKIKTDNQCLYENVQKDLYNNFGIVVTVDCLDNSAKDIGTLIKSIMNIKTRQGYRLIDIMYIMHISKSELIIKYVKRYLSNA